MAPLVCTNCATTPVQNATIATEPLSLAYVLPAPSTIVSAQVQLLFLGHASFILKELAGQDDADISWALSADCSSVFCGAE